VGRRTSVTLIGVNTRAADELARVTIRILIVLRCAQVGFLVVFVVAWWADWYGQHPVQVVAPAAVVAWCVFFIVAVAPGSRPEARLADGAATRAGGVTLPLVAADVLVAVVSGAGTSLVTPPAFRGDSSSWVFIGLATTAVVAASCLGWWWFTAALLGMAAANFAGAPGHRAQVVASTMLLTALGFVIKGGFGRLRSVALAADTWLNATFDRRMADAVAQARAVDAREQERMIHDTVLNTLTAVGWGAGGDVAIVRTRCGRSVDTVQALLAGAGPEGSADMATCVRDVVAEECEAGLAVNLDIRPYESPTRPGGFARVLTRVRNQIARLPYRIFSIGEHWSVDHAGADSAGAGDPPAEVVAAFAAALREALTNVARHAGTWHARVGVIYGPAYVRISVRDEGVGFDPEPPDPQDVAVQRERKLGLRRSVTDRIADVGGWDEITSSPGHGTTVVLNWRAPQAAPADMASVASLRRDYATAVGRTIGTGLLIGLALVLVPLVSYLHRVHSQALAVGLWVVTAAAAGMAVSVVSRRPLRRAEALGVVVIAIEGCLAGTLNVIDGADALRIVNWPLVTINLILMALVVISRPLREWVLGCILVSGVSVAVVLGVAGTGPAELVRLTAALYSFWAMQVLVVGFGPALGQTARTTALAAEADVELAARQDAATAIRRDRQRRLAELEAHALPLLRDIAAGESDPHAPAVRRACKNRAGVLRRMLVASGGSTSKLSDLEVPIMAAEARGTTVDVQVSGDLRPLPPQVRAVLAERVGEALAPLAGGKALVTALCSLREVRVYLSYPVPAPAHVPALAWAPPCPPEPTPPGAGLRTPGISFRDAPGSPDTTLPDGTTLRACAEVGDGVAFLELHWSATPPDPAPLTP
jgi:signal transduction histidine kinase